MDAVIVTAFCPSTNRALVPSLSSTVMDTAESSAATVQSLAETTIKSGGELVLSVSWPAAGAPVGIPSAPAPWAQVGLESRETKAIHSRARSIPPETETPPVRRIALPAFDHHGNAGRHYAPSEGCPATRPHPPRSPLLTLARFLFGSRLLAPWACAPRGNRLRVLLPCGCILHSLVGLYHGRRPALRWTFRLKDSSSG